jgi:hypothetical protein
MTAFAKSGFAIVLVALFVLNPLGLCAANAHQRPAHSCCPGPVHNNSAKPCCAVVNVPPPAASVTSSHPDVQAAGLVGQIDNGVRAAATPVTRWAPMFYLQGAVFLRLHQILI